MSLLLFCMVFFSACKTNQPETTTVVTTDSVKLKADSIDFQEPSTITPVFLSLIKYLDSVGNIYDTVRYCPKADSLLWVDGYAVFKEDTGKSILNKDDAKEFCSQFIFFDNTEEINKYIKNFDEKVLLAVNNTYTYYSRVKEPQIDNDGAKWWIDGVVTEWQFSTPVEAKKAAKMISDYELIFYTKTSACIAVVDSCMYIFTARAAGFVHIQGKYCAWLVKTYNGTKY